MLFICLVHKPDILRHGNHVIMKVTGLWARCCIDSACPTHPRDGCYHLILQVRK